MLWSAQPVRPVARSLWVGLVSLPLLAFLASAAHAQTINACSAAKKKCVAKKVKALLGCHAQAESKGIALDLICVAKATAKFDGGATPAKGCFAKLEAKYPPASAAPCLTAGDTAAIEAKVDAFVDDVVGDVDPGYPTPVLNKCAAGKKKCIAKKAQALLGCHAKAAKTGALDLICIAKAKAKFDGGSTPAKGCLEKLEAKYGPASDAPCLTFDDTAALEAKIDTFVDDVVCDLDPAGGTCGPAVPTPTPTPTGPACGGPWGVGFACGGACPAGESCTADLNLGGCACVDASTCTAGAFCIAAGCPSCPPGFFCAPPEIPVCVGGSCDASCDCATGECAVGTLPTPGPTATPGGCGGDPGSCSGACPPGQFCRTDGAANACVCVTGAACQSTGLCVAAGCPACPPGYLCAPPTVPLCIDGCDANCLCSAGGDCTVNFSPF